MITSYAVVDSNGHLGRVEITQGANGAPPTVNLIGTFTDPIIVNSSATITTSNADSAHPTQVNNLQIATQKNGSVKLDGNFSEVKVNTPSTLMLSDKTNITGALSLLASAIVNAGTKATVANITVATENSTDAVVITGNIKAVQITKPSNITIGAGSTIGTISATIAAAVTVAPTAVVTNVASGTTAGGPNSPVINFTGATATATQTTPAPTAVPTPVPTATPTPTPTPSSNNSTVVYTTATPTISGVVRAGDTSVSGTAPAGSTVVLKINGLAQPSVIATAGGAWTVTGLTLAQGNVVTVTAQTTGRYVSSPATTTVAIPLPVPAAPAVTANDTANAITGIDNTMEFKVDAAAYIKYNGTNVPNLAGIHTVLVRVAAVTGVNNSGAEAALHFTFANAAPAAPAVTADDAANVITGINNTMEFKLDGATYVRYTGTNAPNLVGAHTVLVRVAENLATDTPVGAEKSLAFTMATPAAPGVTADDATNTIAGIDNTMEFKVDAAAYVKYDGANVPNLAGIHTVLVRVAAVPDISYTGTAATLNFTFANAAPAAPAVTADDDANVMTGINNTMEFKVDAAAYVRYTGTNAPNLVGAHTVLIRVAENLATDTPVGAEKSLTFTMATPAVPAVTVNDTTNTIVGIDNTMEFKVDAAAYVKYDGTNVPNLAGIHTVLVRVAAVVGISYAGAVETLNFTFANAAPAAPAVTADDDANVMTGINDTMEFSVDAGPYVRYTGTNAPNLAGEHIVSVRVAENLGTDTPAGAAASLVFTIKASIASVSATNGQLTITLLEKPTVAPITGDFTATSAIDGAAASALTLTGFSYDNNVTVTYNFAPISQIATLQSVVVAVTLGGNVSTANAFTVEILSAQQAALNAVNATVQNFGLFEPLSLDTINTATGQTNGVSAYIGLYRARIQAGAYAVNNIYTADTLFTSVDIANVTKEQELLKSLGGAGLICEDVNAASVVFSVLGSLTAGTGVTFRVSYGYNTNVNVIPSNISGKVIIDRNGGGTIRLDVDVIGMGGTVLYVKYDVTVPATGEVTWVVLPN